MTKYPDWVCHDCGTKYGKWYQDGVYSGPSSGCSTMHYGKCGVCNAENVAVTEPRDYGHLLECKLKDLHKANDDNNKKSGKTRKPGPSGSTLD